MRSLIKHIHAFYKYDCCWPYAVSFFLTLMIYYLDFFRAGTRCHWASPVAYGILLAYFLYNLHLYSRGKIKATNAPFALLFLSFKLTVLGLVLCLLYVLR